MPYGYERIAAEAARLESEGSPVTYAALGLALGCTTHTASSYVSKARRMGLWRWRMVLAKPTREEMAWSSLSSKPVPYDPAEIEARKAMVRQEALAGMLDGRGEIDEPPHGVAPRSGKDHAVESRRRFEVGSTGSGYQRRSHGSGIRQVSRQ